MPKVRDSRIFNLPAQEIYTLMMDMERYPDFIPFVRRVKILGQKNGVTTADIRIGVTGLDFSYRCAITETPYERISIRDVSGPFAYLRCEITFEEIADDQTRVVYDFDSQFKSRLMNRLADPVFNVVLQSTLAEVQRFLQRRR